MWFYSVVFFILIIFLSIGYFLKVQKLTYWISLGILMVIAAFRTGESSRDYFIYVDYYNDIDNIPITFLEPTYFLFVAISKVIFDGPIGVFIIYSIIGVGLKGWAFIKLSKYYSISLIVYFGSFFLLHEMTQIRVGVAAAILLLSIPSIVDRKPFAFLSLLIIGSLFHYSLMIFAFVYFLDPRKVNPWIYISVIGITFLAAMAGFNMASFFELVRLGFISDKLNAYKALMEEGVHSDIQLINPLLFLRIGIVTTLLLNWKVLQEKNKYSTILIKVYSFSVFFFIAFADLPVLAGRTSQLFGIVEIIVVPFVIYLLNPKYIAVILAILFAMLIFYKQLYYSDLVSSYF
jgi:hypothetical protein